MFFKNFGLCMVMCLTFGGDSESKEIKKTLNVFYVQSRGHPDGVVGRRILTANGEYPGPLIECQEGDTLHIKVINKIHAHNSTNPPNGTEGSVEIGLAIHWHGIFQKGSPFSDGVEAVTQCTIPHDQSMDYVFKADQFGTYWWHAHTFYQYTEGLYGPLIIHPKEPALPAYMDSNYFPKYPQVEGEEYPNSDDFPDSSRDIIIILSDWNHLNAAAITEWFLSPLSTGNEPIPDSCPLNGRAFYPCEVALEQGLECDHNIQKHTKFWVTKGEVYRFRVISAAAFAGFAFSIDRHQMEVIATDGNLVERKQENKVDVFTIAPAQRVDILVKMEDTQADRFWIRARVIKDAFPDGVNINENPEALANETRAVLIYESEDERQKLILKEFPFQYKSVFSPHPNDANFELPLEFDPQTNLVTLNEADLSYAGGPAPEPKLGQDMIWIWLLLSSQPDENNVVHLNFNGNTYLPTEGDKPLLVKAILDETFIFSDNPFWIYLNRVIQIVVNNVDGGPHPLHLHGHHFWVMGAGSGIYNGSQLNANGVVRDTAQVEAESWMVIRFFSDNPGVWLFHCHIQWHAIGGLTIALIEGQDQIRETISIPNQATNICENNGIPL